MLLKSKYYFLRSYFFHRFFLLAVLFLIVQQIIVALSVFFLAKGIFLLALGNLECLNWFIAYIVSLMTPYLPGVASNFFFELWKVESIRIFQSYAISNHPYTPKDFSNVIEGENRTTLFPSTAPNVIKDGVDYVHNFLGSFLNSIFTLFAISYSISIYFDITYLISFLGCFIYSYYFSKIAKNKANIEESSRIDLFSLTCNVWPNISLKNDISELAWKYQFGQKFSLYFLNLKSESYFRNLSGFLLAMINVIPTATFILYLVSSHRQDLAYISVVFASSPRIFQLLIMQVELSTLIFGFNRLRGQLGMLSHFFEPLNSRNMNLKNITVSSEKMKFNLNHNDEQFLNLLRQNKTGRYLIEGPNGAGKTSLLLQIKEKIGHSAFYLPSQSALMIHVENNRDISTGERKSYEIKTILNNKNIMYFLLDEWDANLDSQNLNQIDLTLAEAAKHVVIIEVRHRR